MAENIIHTGTAETQPDYWIPIVGTFPGTSPDIFEVIAPPGTKALVMESNAHASPAENLNPVIRKLTDQGTAVFILTDNWAGHRGGITQIVDQPQAGALAAGAFFLETLGRETINDPDHLAPETMGNLRRVIEAIKEGIDEGLTGNELGEHVHRQFSYPEGEKPARLDPVVALRAMHERLKAEGLGGLPYTAYQELKRWESEAR